MLGSLDFVFSFAFIDLFVFALERFTFFFFSFFQGVFLFIFFVPFLLFITFSYTFFSCLFCSFVFWSTNQKQKAFWWTIIGFQRDMTEWQKYMTNLKIYRFERRKWKIEKRGKGKENKEKKTSRFGCALLKKTKNIFYLKTY